jgi:hypothetical protein
MDATEKHSVRERTMDWVAAFWEGKVYPMPVQAHTTPEPDDMPPPKNDPVPLEVPQPDPPPIQDPIPHQEPPKHV